LHVTERPAPDTLAAWRALLAAHRRITDALEEELRAATGLNLARYDVLLQLSEAPGVSLRMTDLAEAVLLSKSGLTRLVDRMCGEGLIERSRDAADRRSLVVTLTPAGRRALRRAAPVHLRGIQQHFGAALSAEQTVQVRGILESLGRPRRRNAARSNA
jgi:DNA-binding MarR family transcriptional regulator